MPDILEEADVLLGKKYFFDLFESFSAAGRGVAQKSFIDPAGNLVEFVGSELVWIESKAIYDLCTKWGGQELSNQQFSTQKDNLSKITLEMLDIIDQDLVSAGILKIEGTTIQEIKNSSLKYRCEAVVELVKGDNSKASVADFFGVSAFAIFGLEALKFVPVVSMSGSTIGMMNVLADLAQARVHLERFDAANEDRSLRAAKAAKRRHNENHELREQAQAFYESNRNRFKTFAQAAREITKQVPITERTAEKWIRQFRKEN